MKKILLFIIISAISFSAQSKNFWKLESKIDPMSDKNISARLQVVDFKK